MSNDIKPLLGARFMLWLTQSFTTVCTMLSLFSETNTKSKAATYAITWCLRKGSCRSRDYENKQVDIVEFLALVGIVWKSVKCLQLVLCYAFIKLTTYTLSNHMLLLLLIWQIIYVDIETFYENRAWWSQVLRFMHERTHLYRSVTIHCESKKTNNVTCL